MEAGKEKQGGPLAKTTVTRIDLAIEKQDFLFTEVTRCIAMTLSANTRRGQGGEQKKKIALFPSAECLQYLGEGRPMHRTFTGSASTAEFLEGSESYASW